MGGGGGGGGIYKTKIFEQNVDYLALGPGPTSPLPRIFLRHGFLA